MPTTTSAPQPIPPGAFTAVAAAVTSSTPRMMLHFTSNVVLVWSDTQPAGDAAGTPAGPDDDTFVGGGGGDPAWQGFTGTLWARSVSGTCQAITHANS